MLASHYAAHEIFERLAKADPTNALGGSATSLSRRHTKLGDAQREQGRTGGGAGAAGQVFARDQEIVWLRADPRNACGNATSLPRTKKSATCKHNRASSAAASSSNQHLFAIRAWVSPRPTSGNAAWQRDLADGPGRLGTTWMRQGSRAS